MMRKMEIAGGGVPVLIRIAPENNGEREGMVKPNSIGYGITHILLG